MTAPRRSRPPKSEGPPPDEPRRPYRAVPVRPALGVVLAVIALVTLRVLTDRDARRVPPDSPSATARPAAESEVRVERVVDGDTLLVEGGLRVRLLGVDTPESAIPNVPPEPLGKEASEFTRRFVEAAGGRLRLTFDREPYDRHGRRLAWAWNGETLLNEELVRTGLSPAVTSHPYSAGMKDRLRTAERHAKRLRIGLWADESSPSSTSTR